MTSVVLWAEQWDSMRSFYARLLDAETLEQSESFIHLSSGANEVFLHRLSAEFVSVDASYPAREDAPLKPVFYLQHAPSIEGLIRESQYGSWTYRDLLDPDGNVIQVAFGDAASSHS